MAARWNDWLRQATRDLDQARDSQRAERHEWACFAAHQAAEKAVKALHLHLGQEAWGTSWQSCSDRKSTRLNSSHSQISYAVFCLKKKKCHSERLLSHQAIPPSSVRVKEARAHA